MAQFLSEADIEGIALASITAFDGFTFRHGRDFEPDGVNGRSSFKDAVLIVPLREAVLRLNPSLDQTTVDAAIRKVVAHETDDLVANNRRFHRFLVEGVPYEYRDDLGAVRYGRARLVALDEPANNDFLVVNQFTVHEHKRARRPDVVIFVNGLPLGVIEFKDPTDPDATVESAFNQLQTYKDEIPNFCAFNEFMVISDGAEARLGAITSDFSRFQPWKAIDARDEGRPQILTLAEGVFRPDRLLDILRYFVLFETDGAKVSKKIAAYHQYRATNLAIEATLRATAKEGERRIGVVWHTQGSGKSLTMVFYCAKAIQLPQLENPTLVVITDRNDLDDQLFGQFARCQELLRDEPVQARDREQLRELLSVAAGGIVFTTIQKFFPQGGEAAYPTLTERRNVIVIADEAHRSQYDMIDGFARHMRDALPNASFIGFTGTPIEIADRSTSEVFGSYVDTYDIAQSVEDGATVPIYYEARIAKLNLKPEQVPKLDEGFEDITEGEAEDRARNLRTKWASIEALVGAEERIKEVSADLVAHFEERSTYLEGKAMNVCMSRRIAVEMYEAIGKLRPQWVDEDDSKGLIKVVMTGSASDGAAWQKHLRSKTQQKTIETRFKDPADPMKLVIVCDKWLTGFDVPSLHTLYMDKPMRRHSLMQAIARVNRVFKDKPGGLVVDYIGLADELKRALAIYTESGGRGKPLLDEDEATSALQTKFEIVRAMFDGFDFRPLLTAAPDKKIAGLMRAADFILGHADGRDRYLANTTALLQAFALCSTSDYGMSLRDEIGFFQAVRARIVKTRGRTAKSDAELDSAVKQLVAQAVASEGIVDILSEAGIKRTDISILSDEFLLEVRGLPQRNLAKEMLERLLRDEIRKRAQKNAVRAKAFSEMLQAALLKYKNNAIETAQLISMLIDLAKEMRAEDARISYLKLSEDEVAFYDALAENESAVQVLGNEKLRFIASDLVKTVRANVTLDWSLRETAKANIRRIIRRILKQYGYPPDAQAKAVETVLEQAELLCASDAG